VGGPHRPCNPENPAHAVPAGAHPSRAREVDHVRRPECGRRDAGHVQRQREPGIRRPASPGLGSAHRPTSERVLPPPERRPIPRALTRSRHAGDERVGQGDRTVGCEDGPARPRTCGASPPAAIGGVHVSPSRRACSGPHPGGISSILTDRPPSRGPPAARISVREAASGRPAGHTRDTGASYSHPSGTRSGGRSVD
jgi:hypothetical protein